MSDKQPSKADGLRVMREAKFERNEVPIAKPEPKQKATTTRSSAAGRYKTTGSRLASERIEEAAGKSAIVPAAPVLKRGRPRIGEVRAKPWLDCDPPMSKTTYWRRQKEKAK